MLWENEYLRYAYNGEYYPLYLNYGNAASHILKTAQKYCHGAGIDVGGGKWCYPGAVLVEDEEHQNAYKLDSFADESLDYVFSSHCIEHLDRWQEALRLWISKLKQGGTLFIYAPHESMQLWQNGSPWVGDAHKWSPTWQVLTEFLEANGVKVVEVNKERDEYYSFHVVAIKQLSF